MDNLALYMLIRGLLSLALVAGGIYALHKGFQLYVGGVGLAEDGFRLRTSDQLGGVSVSLKRVGSVVMLTAVAWAFLGYLVMPKQIRASPQDFATCVGPSSAEDEN